MWAIWECNPGTHFGDNLGKLGLLWVLWQQLRCKVLGSKCAPAGVGPAVTIQNQTLADAAKK